MFGFFTSRQNKDLAMGPLILALKVFLYFVFLNARTQRRASNETFDPGFKSPTDACCGLQMAPPENLNAFLSFLELDRSRCRRVAEAAYYISGREFFTVGDNLGSECAPDTRRLISCRDICSAIQFGFRVEFSNQEFLMFSKYRKRGTWSQ